MSENSSPHNHLPAAKPRRSWWPVVGLVAWVIVMFIVAQLLTIALFWALVQLGVPFEALSPTAIRTLEVFVAFALALLLTIGLPWWLRRRKTTLKELGLTRLPMWSDILLGPITVVPYFIVSAIVLSLAALVPGFEADQIQDTGFSSVVDTTSLLLAFVSLVVLAPIVEEALFRGYLYGKLRSRMGVIASTLLVSACFGVLHLQANVGLDVFILSIAMCILRETTGSIWAGTLLHMTKNAIAFYVLFVAPVMIH